MAYRKKPTIKAPKRHHNVIDDRSGFKIKSTDAVVDHDGIVTHKDDMDVRSATDYPDIEIHPDVIGRPINSEETTFDENDSNATLDYS